MRLLPAAVLSLVLVASTAATAPTRAATPDASAPSTGRPAAKAVPQLRVTTLAKGLDHPWDVRSIGKGRVLFTERDKATLSVVKNGRTRAVKFPSRSVWVSGETGLMGLEVDPRFATNHRIYTCQGGTTPSGHDVRVIAWRMNKKATRVTRIKKLIGGLPTSSGRHGGCRLLITGDGSLLVGTGDAAIGTNPEDLTSLGGKTLRLNRKTGAPWPTNPFVDSANVRQRYVHTYGHRNVQGLAERADGSLWSVEQGTFRDDEVNRLVNGGDYGYNPVPGYNEQVPMTDQGLPGTQVDAAWSSGDPTIATSGASFVNGSRWGVLDGALAVGVQKGQEVLFLTFDDQGALQRARAPRALREFGRIRQVVQSPGGALWVTTDNGSGADLILKVRPR